MEYGYARVSTREQNEDRRLIALAGWGIQKKNIIIDKQSGNQILNQKAAIRTQSNRRIRWREKKKNRLSD